MKSRPLLRQLLLGLLLGFLLIPPQPAQAFPVYDAAVHSQLVKDSITRAREWIEKVRQYQQMFDKAVRQLTTMRGILGIVDEQLAKDKQLALLTYDLGEIIRGSFSLKRRLEVMIRYRVRALQSIDDRLSRGIFDPEADLRDLEEYLRYSIGRSSRQTVRQMVRTASADSQLAAWLDEKQRLEHELAIAGGLLKQAERKLEGERRNAADPRNIQPLNDIIAHYSKSVDDLKKRIADLNEKINQRLVQYGVRIEDMEQFGYQVQSVNDAWASINQTKDNIASTLDALITGE